MARDRKRGGGGDDGGGERWLATYGDAVTLLMAFFVMLYAMSTVDALKFEAFVSGLEGPFDNKSIEQGLLDAGPGIVGNAIPQAAGEQGARPAPVEVVDRPQGAPQPEASATASPQERVPDQLERVQAELEAGLAAVGFPSDVADFRRNERGLVVSIATDDVLFDSGSAQVVQTGQVLVATVADVLKRFPNDIVVEGHTDNVPLRRGGYTNWNLSTDRAVAVLSLLTEAHGFPAQRLGAAGYGEYRPRVPNETPEQRALNRRVDVLVIAEGEATDG
jgi:chemotaxis protein MotB